jgi:DNA-binding NtrC family response regulator
MNETIHKNRFILFADNNEAFREIRSEWLVEEGFKVFQASSPEKARDILDHQNIDLTIIDIRLMDDEDEYDLSGVEIAKDTKYGSIPKIIMTGFPSVTTVKVTLGNSEAKNLYYLAKDEGAIEMIKVVKKIFSNFS